MTYASTRVEAYILPDDLRRVVNLAAQVRGRVPGMRSVTLTRSQYRQLAAIIERQSDQRMTLDRCAIADLPVAAPAAAPRMVQQGMSL